MTIIELEQGLRNLIATEPAVLAGNLGDVIRSVLGVTEAYRNYVFKVQTYPVQDVFRFTLLSNLQRIEGDITGSALAMLNERGINMMLYVPQGPYGADALGGYGMGGASYGMGSMPYGSLGQMGPASFGSPSSFQGMEGSRPSRPKVTTSYAGYEPTGKPTFASATETTAESVQKTMTASSKSKTMKPEVNFTPKKEKTEEKVEEKAEESPELETETKTESQPKKPNPAEMLMGEGDPAADEKAVGRNYLLELLKK